MNSESRWTAVLAAAGMALLPHHFLCACMYEATRIRLPAWKNWQIRWFAKRYRVNLEEARYPDARCYTDFNAFFTRALRADARVMERGDQNFVCPADGTLSEFGAIHQGLLLQAKGRHYGLEALLAGDSELRRMFSAGQYLTVYLSPRDYHRVHMPARGVLQRMIHVPGRLFSVNAASAASVDQLFARNERVISVFDTPLGAMAVILVGALFVGSIEHIWAGQVTPAHGAEIRRFDYRQQPRLSIDQGAEMGRFNMGSTVVVLVQNPELEWCPRLQAGQPLRLGRTLARL